jgi:sigma-B regulation protein RsbU (phosphoserine phosphatase)
MGSGFSISLKLMIAAAAALVCVILVLYRRLAQLSIERNELLQQKDVVFDFVYDVSEVFAGADSANLPDLLKRVLSYAVRTSKASAGALYILEPDGATLSAAAVAGVFPPLVHGLDAGMQTAFSKVRHVERLVREQTARVGEGLVGETVSRGAAVLIEDAEMDPRVPRFDEGFLRMHTLLLVPLRFRQEVLGVTAVVNRIDGRSFTPSDAGLLQALIDQAAVSIHYARVSAALDEKRRLDHDLGVARVIQTALLPRHIPARPGVEIGAFSLPAQQIGGDYYDFVEVDEDHLGIAVADVSGKGVSGAIVMAMCRSVLRIAAPGCLSPAKVLHSVNRLLAADVSEDMFITMLYMVLNTRTRELTVARAGHPEVVVQPPRQGGAWTVRGQGMAVGLAPNEIFEANLDETRVTLGLHDTVVAYTDGVTEAQDMDGREWGLLNLVKTMEQSAMEDGGASRLAANVRSKLLAFVGDVPQYDDMTLVALRITAGAEEA